MRIACSRQTAVAAVEVHEVTAARKTLQDSRIENLSTSETKLCRYLLHFFFFFFVQPILGSRVPHIRELQNVAVVRAQDDR